MKKKIKSFPLIHPTTIGIVGTSYNDSVNFTTIGDIAVAGLNPPLVMVSLNINHLATEYILTSNRLSLNMPTKDMLSFVDYCGIHSGRDVDKSTIEPFEVMSGLPILKRSPIALILQVVHTYQHKQRFICICEVEETHIDEELLENGKLSLSNLKMVLYGLDNHYYTSGEIIGEGYKVGKE